MSVKRNLPHLQASDCAAYKCAKLSKGNRLKKNVHLRFKFTTHCLKQQQ